MTITKMFVLERETKGAIRYAECNEDGNVAEFSQVTIGTLYIRKSALNGDIPATLKVIIEADVLE